MEFEDYCTRNGIITICMPAHSSHKLQPLDLVPFSVLKRAYGLYVEGLMRRHQTHLEKQDFLAGFLTAFKAAFTESNIQSGFEAAGLVPLDPERVIFTLDVTEVARTPTPNPDLPPPVWTSKTPTTTTEAESQSALLKSSVQRH